MTEEEEFEFRLRYEQEQQAGQTQPASQEREGGVGGRVFDAAKKFVTPFAIPKAILNKENIQELRDAGAGLVRGAGSIGATILAPADMVNSYLGGSGFWNLDQNRQRRKDIDAGLAAMGADTSTNAYAMGKLGGEIAGTAGAGGAIAQGVKAIPMLANVAPKLATALESGGFKIGQKATTLPGKLVDAAIRTGAGATVGGIQAGLVDPRLAGSGAIIGGAMPGTLKALGGAANLAKRSTSALARNTAGMLTGAGGDAVSVAYKSGKAGNRAFLEHMRGPSASADDIVAQAKEAIGNMRAERASAYRGGMVDIKSDRGVIDFAPIKSSVSKIAAMGSFKGQQINKNAAGTVQEISDTVNQWAGLDPAEFHTPEGLDALKQAIGDIRDSTQFGTPARRAADSVYNAVKGEINKQAPAYAKVMKDYSDASEALREVEKAFSTGEKASQDTTLRKLLSVMRNNVNTNFGNRKELAQRLVDSGARDLFPSIAGLSMSSPTPRGLQGLAATGTSVAGLANPAFWAALPFQSPRLMGEAAYGLGRVGGRINAISNDIRQAGLLNPALREQEQALLRSIPLLSISGNP